MKRLALAALAACSSQTLPPPPVVEAAWPTYATLLHCPGADVRVRATRSYDGDPAHVDEITVAGRAKPVLELGPPRNDEVFAGFSPDCRHALVLLSREGPFHIVRVDQLAARRRTIHRREWDRLGPRRVPRRRLGFEPRGRLHVGLLRSADHDSLRTSAGLGRKPGYPGCGKMGA
jgi:hypothetical protein